MSIWLRFFWVVISGFFKKKLDVCDTSVLSQHVWLDELDINVHMNNAKYLAVMDLGRTDWIVRTGAWRLMRWARSRGAVMEPHRALPAAAPSAVLSGAGIGVGGVAEAEGA